MRREITIHSSDGSWWLSDIANEQKGPEMSDSIYRVTRSQQTKRVSDVYHGKRVDPYEPDPWPPAWAVALMGIALAAVIAAGIVLMVEPAV